jgi:predicted  nucleic acid-binding Zn-ribbon protein
MISIRGLLLATAFAALLIGIYTKKAELSRIETRIDDCRKEQESATKYEIERRADYQRDIQVLQSETQRLRETIAKFGRSNNGVSVPSGDDALESASDSQ